MKALFISVLAFLSFCFSIVENKSTGCKKWGGVYKTSSSYLQNQLSDSVCIESKGNFIHEGILNRIVIKTGKEKKIYYPGGIFAYSDGETIFRYFETKGAMSPYGYFKIEDTSGLIIYSQNHIHSLTEYYYSKKINSSIELLRVSNLKNDFKNDGFMNEIKKLKNLSHKLGDTFEINTVYKKYFR